MEERCEAAEAACVVDGNPSTDHVLRHTHGQQSSSMEIQLAPSETKPFTRLILCTVFYLAMTFCVLCCIYSELFTSKVA